MEANERERGRSAHETGRHAPRLHDSPRPTSFRRKREPPTGASVPRKREPTPRRADRYEIPAYAGMTMRMARA